MCETKRGWFRSLRTDSEIHRRCGLELRRRRTFRESYFRFRQSRRSVAGSGSFERSSRRRGTAGPIVLGEVSQESGYFARIIEIPRDAQFQVPGQCPVFAALQFGRSLHSEQSMSQQSAFGQSRLGGLRVISAVQL